MKQIFLLGTLFFLFITMASCGIHMAPLFTAPTGSGAPVLANSPTIVSPIINGTPSGNGIPTIVVQSENEGYPASSSWGTIGKISYTAIVPSGKKLTITIFGVGYTSSTGLNGQVSIGEDGTPVGFPSPIENTLSTATALQYVFAGDGVSHTWTVMGINGSSSGTVMVAPGYAIFRIEASN